MRKLICTLIVLIVAGLVWWWGYGQALAQEPTAKIDPQLLAQLDAAGTAPFIVHMHAEADLSTIVTTASADEVQRRAQVITRLQETAQSSQAPVLDVLAGAGVGGQASDDVQSLWIINAVAAQGTLTTVLSLADLPTVAAIQLDETVQLPPIQAQQVVTATNWGLARIRADVVNDVLGLDGTGIVIASLDSGVDWQHPALQAKYRGYRGPGLTPDHTGNWYDVLNNSTYPVDSYFHGTHTLGTALADAVGVAPGAQWIAVRAFDNSGTAETSNIHAAFQWLLAPNGDPALAPDVVINSWGSSNGSNVAYVEDVEALRMAGIIPIFSAGNSGPANNTVSAPGSYTVTLAVGAVIENNQVALFSSRGPSPFSVTKPDIVAPGDDIISTVPGGGFGALDGTSMATPHVVGTVALMLQANPALDQETVFDTLRNTAAPLSTAITPNNNEGWGMLDTYAAVRQVSSFGELAGTVSDAATNAPISEATIQVLKQKQPLVAATTNAEGRYEQSVSAGIYDVQVTAFGYESTQAAGLTVTTNTTTLQNFTLTPQSTGTLAGSVTERGTGVAISASLTIDGLAQPISSQGGSYAVELPVGSYTITVRAVPYRVERVSYINIQTNTTATVNFRLTKGPTILLVDAGEQFQESEISFYQQALDDAHYTYVTLPITATAPTSETLKLYDVVIWSDPFGSPGSNLADPAIIDYLDAGGKILLSGQDIAYYDILSQFFDVLTAYLRDYFKVSYLADDAEQDILQGVVGQPFEGLSLSIAGGNGADNQVYPDVITTAEGSFVRPLLQYEDGRLAAQYAGYCLPYQAIFMAFGFEAINTRPDRQTVMERSLDLLLDPPPAYGVYVTPKSVTTTGNFGDVVNHTAQIVNRGTNADTFQISYTSGWPVNPEPPATLTLEPCQTQVITAGVRVNTQNRDVSDTLLLTVQSTSDPTVVESVTRQTKSPAPLLVVDDGRFYDVAGAYEASLTMPYDDWSVETVESSPTLTVLQRYPMVIWFTSYDWVDPLTPAEEDRLAAYLDGGGRLFFSGQDYIFNLPGRVPSDFTRDYLGVTSHAEDFASTSVTGEPGNIIGDGLGPATLTFPDGYDNWTDALFPTNTAQVVSRGQVDQINGVMNQGQGSGGAWHTVFLTYGLELMPTTDRTQLLTRIIGWLNWLGESRISQNAADVADGSTINYAAQVFNNGPEAVSNARFVAFIPPQMQVQNFSPDLTLDPLDNILSWTGTLNPNETKQFVYTTLIDNNLPLGVTLAQVNRFSYPAHAITFDRTHTLQVNFPDLSSASWAVDATWPEPGETINYTLDVTNTGTVAAPVVTITNAIPDLLTVVGDITPSTGQISQNGPTLTWILTPLGVNRTARLTYRAVISEAATGNITNDVRLDDGVTTLNREIVTRVRLDTLNLPVILNQ